VRYKSAEEGSKAKEFMFPLPAASTTTCSVKLEVCCTTVATASLIIIASQGLTPGIQYKINITAIVEDTKQAKIESKALHGKVNIHDKGNKVGRNLTIGR
jgi:hypothetical protein